MGNTSIKLANLLERGVDKAAFFFLALAIFRYFDTPIPSFEGATVLTISFVITSLVILFIRVVLEALFEHPAQPSKPRNAAAPSGPQEKGVSTSGKPSYPANAGRSAQGSSQTEESSDA